MSSNRSQLFSPVNIQGMELKNRIVMSPMCMYSCPNEDGQVMNWHRTHYTSRAVGGVGLIIVEATAVTPQGRISPQDLGIWSDDHVAGLRELVNMVHEQGAKIGIQIAHAGRKAMIDGPIIAPSDLPFDSEWKVPEAMDQEQIRATVAAFAEGARRAKEAGFDCIEIHGAHGYLISEFLSPLSNKREDEYGGGIDGRYRFLGEVIDAVKTAWSGPLLVRVSAADYEPGGNSMEAMIEFAKRMKEQGVGLVDCSSGGVVPAAISPYPGYQVPLAEQIRRGADIATGAVGLITSAVQAEQIIRSGQADVVLLARELLREPYWPRLAAKELGVKLDAPKQYERAW